MPFLPEYLWMVGAENPTVKALMKDIPEDERKTIVRAVIHATAQHIIDVNPQPVVLQ